VSGIGTPRYGNRQGAGSRALYCKGSVTQDKVSCTRVDEPGYS
jgi:hypothetical protein